MSELKTLKDLKREENNGPSSMGGDDIVEVEDLKQNVIKWIKSRIEFCNRCVWDSKSGETKMKFLHCREHKFWIDRFDIIEGELR